MNRTSKLLFITAGCFGLAGICLCVAAQAWIAAGSVATCLICATSAIMAIKP